MRCAVVPSRFEINVAENAGFGWDGRPVYKWLCTVNAGTYRDHAKAVAEHVKRAFPEPYFRVDLRQVYEASEIVSEF